MTRLLALLELQKEAIMTSIASTEVLLEVGIPVSVDLAAEYAALLGVNSILRALTREIGISRVPRQLFFER